MKHFLFLPISLLIACQNATPAPVVVEIEEPPVESPTAKVIHSEVTYLLNDYEIKLTQLKGDGSNFYCKAKLRISLEGKTVDNLMFSTEPVGGYYGVSKGIELEDHLIFTVHGDYDGRTLIVTPKGEMHNLIGGRNFYDASSNLLFCNYESDAGGFSVFDLSTDLLLFTTSDRNDEFISFHKAYGNRYFATSINSENDTAIWEVETFMNRIMQVDLTTQEINASNEFTRLPVQDVYCECKD
ncbi:MAG: hypothetical protein EP346_03920 [Bacteroidetes bacterium]|nr:MAG: hypothetical protein EP346_03920 [Bacteroidota bacterium]